MSPWDAYMAALATPGHLAGFLTFLAAVTYVGWCQVRIMRFVDNNRRVPSGCMRNTGESTAGAQRAPALRGPTLPPSAPYPQEDR